MISQPGSSKWTPRSCWNTTYGRRRLGSSSWTPTTLLAIAAGGWGGVIGPHFLAEVPDGVICGLVVDVGPNLVQVGPYIFADILNGTIHVEPHLAASIV